MLLALVSSAFIHAQLEKIDALMVNEPKQALALYEELAPKLTGQVNEGGILAHLKGLQAASYGLNRDKIRAISTEVARPLWRTHIDPYLANFMLAIGAAYSRLDQYTNAAMLYDCANNYATKEVRYSLAINSSIAYSRLDDLDAAKKVLLRVDMASLSDGQKSSMYNQLGNIDDLQLKPGDALSNYKKAVLYATKADNIRAQVVQNLNILDVIVRYQTHQEQFNRHVKFTQSLLEQKPTKLFQDHLNLLIHLHEYQTSKDPTDKSKRYRLIEEQAKSEDNPYAIDLLSQLGFANSPDPRVINIESDDIKTNPLYVTYCQFIKESE
ncbi:hypothetical protein NI389_18960 (plasmid) [Pseudoalteromonas xiamenensis]|uniref:hypothetical protein n=1 Tax=Pseudoalteromonas xiamenensis TaxID=882626 RepID=UPI0027E59757|nr:hypothetical protein [Pseudoalteromonas xiamenensis]WMN61887.1 hypothetical protein NI389_18960 [Pseudoalteromonas xiamenensis]